MCVCMHGHVYAGVDAITCVITHIRMHIHVYVYAVARRTLRASVSVISKYSQHVFAAARTFCRKSPLC